MVGEGLPTLRGCRRETNYFPQQHASMLFTAHNELFERLSLVERIQNVVPSRPAPHPFTSRPPACRYFSQLYEGTPLNIFALRIFPSPMTSTPRFPLHPSAPGGGRKMAAVTPPGQRSYLKIISFRHPARMMSMVISLLRRSSPLSWRKFDGWRKYRYSMASEQFFVAVV